MDFKKIVNLMGYFKFHAVLTNLIGLYKQAMSNFFEQQF